MVLSTHTRNTLDEKTMTAKNSLTGKILMATPMIRDERFDQTLIYIIAHSRHGAMGIICNKVVESLTFPFLLSQLGIQAPNMLKQQPVHFGGPVETRRGFVLHSNDYQNEDATVRIDKNISLTATMEIVKAIATEKGPKDYMLALGYAGWGSGQLENEIGHTAWLEIPAQKELIFSADDKNKWDQAKQYLGFDISQISSCGGSA